MSTTEILLFAILIAVIMCALILITHSVTREYWQYRSRWEKLEKKQIHNAEELKEKVITYGKNGTKGIFKYFINTFITSVIISLAIYHTIKILTS